MHFIATKVLKVGLIFCFEFQHLIHHNKPLVSRAHSPTNQSVLVSPLLSPPAQFSSPKSKADQMKLAGSASTMGYVTLPRKLNSSNRYCCIFFSFWLCQHQLWNFIMWQVKFNRFLYPTGLTQIHQKIGQVFLAVLTE